MLNDKFKLIPILLFITCLLFVSISSVSAQQITGNNFTVLNDTISNYDTIELTQDIIIKENEIEIFKNGIEINKNLTINGCGKSIDGNHSVRIFYLTNANITLTLKNITLKNGNATNGGAIFSNNNMNLNCSKNVIFYNNIASNEGGAIYLFLGNINITNINGTITFKNNKAKYGGGTIRAYENVIINSYDNVVFNNNTINNNEGSTIFSSKGNIKITSINGTITFKNNKAINGGGTIYAKINVTIESYDNILFSNNIANNGGGAIISNNGMVNITSTKGTITFENNIASTNGGAIYANNDINIKSYEHILFNNNTAKLGGAICSINGMVNITSSNSAITFENNKANVNNGNGGAIRANKNITIKSYNNVLFNNNMANSYGGAIRSLNEMVEITSTNGAIIFKNNKAGGNGKGGAIYAITNVTIKAYHNILFNNNTACNDAGAIYAENGIVNIISTTNNITFENNKAGISSKGGAILGINIIITAINGSISFNNNSAGQFGGAIYAKSVNIKNALFYGNNATNYKIIYVTDWNNSNLTGCYLGLNYKNKTQIQDAKLIGYSNSGIDIYYCPDNWVLLNITSLENIILNQNYTLSLEFNSYTNGTWIKPYDNFTNSIIVKTKYINGIATKYPIAPGKFNITPTKEGKSTLSIINIYTGEEITNTTFNVIKILNVNLKIIAENRVYGENAIIYLYLIDENNKTVSGKVNLTVDKVYEISIINGFGQQDIKDLNAKEYTVFANYTGDLTHFNTTNTTTFNVTKKEIILNANDLILVVGESGNLTVTVSEPINGTITVKYNNKTENVPIKDGKGILTISNLTVGNYTVEISLNNNTNYFANNITSKIIVTKPTIKEDTYISVKTEDIVYGENSTFTIKLVDNNGKAIQANITISLFKDGIFIKTVNRTTDENGTYVSKIKGKSTGIYILVVHYNGNDTMKASSNNTRFKVSKIKTDLNISINNITYGENGVLIINLDQEINVPVFLLINGKFIKTIDLNKGYAKTNLTNYNADTHIITVIFEGDTNYGFSRSSTIWTVEKANTTFTIETENILIEEEEIITVNVGNNLNGIALIKGLLDKDISIKVVKGIGSITISNLNRGTYNIKGIFIENNGNYNNSINTSSFTVIDTNIYIEVSDFHKYYGNDDKFKAILIDGEGNLIINETVTFIINGVSYNKVTDENGTAYLTINLQPGQYPIKITYGLVESYTTITVLTTINASDIELIYKNGTQYEAIFFNSNGTLLTNTNINFNINGVTYTKTTNNKGKASITINLQPGQYTITTYNPLTNQLYSNKVTVLSPIIGNDLTKKYSEKVAYEVCAFDNTGKPLANATIIININGVFYNRVTDENGIARLNINLMPGEYIATASFNGALTSNKITVLNN